MPNTTYIPLARVGARVGHFEIKGVLQSIKPIFHQNVKGQACNAQSELQPQGLYNYSDHGGMCFFL